MREMQINWIECENWEEVQEIIDILIKKYHNNKRFEYREISDTIILENMKFIVAPKWMVDWLTTFRTTKLDKKDAAKNKPNIYKAEFFKTNY